MNEMKEFVYVVVGSFAEEDVPLKVFSVKEQAELYVEEMLGAVAEDYITIYEVPIDDVFFEVNGDEEDEEEEEEEECEEDDDGDDDDEAFEKWRAALLSHLMEKAMTCECQVKM